MQPGQVKVSILKRTQFVKNAHSEGEPLIGIWIVSIDRRSRSIFKDMGQVNVKWGQDLHVTSGEVRAGRVEGRDHDGR